MRLRKKLISALMAACMTVTTLPAGMPLKAIAAEVPEETTKTVALGEPGEEIKIPEVQEVQALLEKIQPEPEVFPEKSIEEIIDPDTEKLALEDNGYGTIALTDEEVGKNKISRDYIPTQEAEFSFSLYLTEKPYTDTNAIIVYLFDRDNKIAAKSVEPTKAENYGYNEWKLYFNSVYRVRELKTDEILYVGYKNDTGEIQKLKDLTVTVTDQPYITDISKGRKYFNGYWSDNSDGLYSGSDSASVVNVSGYNIDFSKMGLKLRDASTNEVVAESESYIEYRNGEAYYCVKWNDGVERYNQYYVVEYSYSDNTKSVVYEEAGRYYRGDKTDRSIVCNPKKYTVEYYNRGIPSGTIISYEIKEKYGSLAICASGSGIEVSKDHSIIIDLKGKLPHYSYSDRFELTIKYEEDGQEKSWAESFYGESYYHYDDNMYDEDIVEWNGVNGFYTTDDTEIEISALVYLDEVMENESKLADTCKVNIHKINNNDSSIGEVELALKKEDGRILYSGVYKGNLELGRYIFYFSPDGEMGHSLTYYFNIYDKDILYLVNQSNHIASGEVALQFESSKMAEWYLKNSDNLNKIKIKILDIEGKEIGTYKYSNGDFTIEDMTENYPIVRINFADRIKRELQDLYYCEVYFYYGDESGDGTVPKHLDYIYDNGIFLYKDFYEDMYSYEAKYVKRQTNNWLEMVNYKKMYYSNYIHYGSRGYNAINGNSSSFPAKLTVTDWHSLKPIKEIIIEKPRQIFTESQLEGLSSDNVYNFFLKGADGSVNMSSGYIYSGEPSDDEYDKPSQTPSPKPTSGTSGGSGSIAPYIPPVSNGGSTDIQPTTAPTVQPEATAAPTAVPTANPTTAPTSAPTTAPTAAPEAIAPPAEVKEPETPVTNNPYVPSQEEKPVLKLKKNKITLKKGQKAKIKITSKLATGVTYKSLKPSVATVSKKGVITAKKAGKAVITVKANGLVKKVQVTVKKTGKTEDKTESTVKTASSVKLGKDFKLAKASVTIKKGKKLTIKKASGLSGKVTFRSLDKKIASVSVNGVVKAKKKGKTTILIKKGNKTIKLKITVKK